MDTIRIALANLPVPTSPDDALARALAAVAEAGRVGAAVLCFPECYVPGYRWAGTPAADVPVDEAFLARAHAAVGEAAGAAGVGVVLGTERVTADGLQITALVFGPDGALLGRQDKCQLDPSEEATYPAFGRERHVFTIGGLTFGIAICHEGFRYPETVRWAARRGARVVFHPHFDIATPGSYRPATFADPANTFHEKAVLCRAAENTCYVATVNCASAGSPTTSAVAGPDGEPVAYQPYGEAGLLVVDLDLAAATGALARRLRGQLDAPVTVGREATPAA